MRAETSDNQSPADPEYTPRPFLEPAVRRPLAGLTLFFIAGTAAGIQWSLPWTYVMAATGLLLLPCFFLPQRPVTLSLLAGLAAMLLGWINAGLALHSPSACELQAVMDRPGEHLRLIGRIADDPVARYTSYDQTVWTFPLELEGAGRLPA